MTSIFMGYICFGTPCIICWLQQRIETPKYVGVRIKPATKTTELILFPKLCLCSGVNRVFPCETLSLSFKPGPFLQVLLLLLMTSSLCQAQEPKCIEFCHEQYSNCRKNCLKRFENCPAYINMCYQFCLDATVHCIALCEIMTPPMDLHWQLLGDTQGWRHTPRALMRQTFLASLTFKRWNQTVVAFVTQSGHICV